MTPPHSSADLRAHLRAVAREMCAAAILSNRAAARITTGFATLACVVSNRQQDIQQDMAIMATKWSDWRPWPAVSGRPTVPLGKDADVHCGRAGIVV
jgi:hypothetical protein